MSSPHLEQAASALAELWRLISESEDPEGTRACIVEAMSVLEANFGPTGIDLDDALFRVELGLLNAEQS